MNEKYIKKLKAKSKRYSVNCGEGLYLRVSSTGYKSWVLRYYQAQKVRDITLGRWPELTLLQAKQVAHLTGTTTERAYLRGDYLEQRRAIMQSWWNYIYSQYCAVCAPLNCINRIDKR